MENPQRQLPAIHVAGTNGKGSVCSLLSAALTSQGLRPGLYTSPHLVSVRERLRIGGEAISEAKFAEIAAGIRADAARLFPAVGPTPTFFEFLTAMAWRWFAQESAKFAILEVGMGGRLDSTNVCEPAITVITSIGLDHIGALGNTLAEIAAEKAGILKPGVPLVCGVRNPEAREVIMARASELRVPVWQLGEDFAVLATEPTDAGQQVQLRLPTGQCTAEIALRGSHQADNTAVAAATLARLARPTTGLERARWPGRLEQLSNTVLLDGAHNMAAMHELVAALPANERYVALFATMIDKEWQEMLALLAPHLCELRITRAENPRSVDPQVVALHVREKHPALQVVTEPDAYAAAELIAQEQRPALIVGSLYLAGDVYSVFRGNAPPPIYCESG